MIEIIEVRGKVDAAHRLLRHRRATPSAGREAALVVTGGSQVFPGSSHKPSLVVSDDSNSAALAIFDAKSFGTDALLYRKLHRQRRGAASDNLGLATLLDLPRKNLARVLDHRAGLLRQDQPYRFHSRRLNRFGFERKQLGNNLGIDAVTEIVRMVDIVAAQVGERFALEQLQPRRCHIGQRHVRTCQVSQDLAIAGEAFGWKSARIVGHGCDHHDVRFGACGLNSIAESAHHRFEAGCRLAVIHAKGQDHQIGLLGRHLGDHLQPPPCTGSAACKVRQRHRRAEALLQRVGDQLRVSRLMGQGLAPRTGCIAACGNAVAQCHELERLLGFELG